MTARTSAELIETYLARLRLELTSAGAADLDDLVAEVRSLLLEAAGADPERAATEIAAFGEPAELAAGILAERGLSSAGGMSSAEWWRMGLAVPLDILIGASVPIAAFFPLYLSLTSDPRPVTPFLLGLGVLFLAALVWPWYIWRPWRAGGAPVSAGMVLTDIAVVRAPGFWRVVRAGDLTTMGLTRPRRSRLSGAMTALLALLLVVSGVWFSADFVSWSTIRGWAERSSGGVAEQRQAATQAVDYLYSSVVDGDFEAARVYVTDRAGLPVRGLALMKERAASDKPVSYRIDGQRRIAAGLWSARVTTTGETGKTYTDTVTVAMSLLVVERGYQSSWIVSSIEGPGLNPAP